MKYFCKVLATLVAAVPVLANAGGMTKYGDWYVNKSIDGIQIASTGTGQGSVVGVACLLDSGKCSAYLSIGTNCNIGATYPVLLNSAVGSFLVTMSCTQMADQKFEVFDQFDTAMQAFQSGGEIGFAIPMQGGEFRVVRFSTTGAMPAIEDARTRPSSPRSDRSGAKREETL